MEKGRLGAYMEFTSVPDTFKPAGGLKSLYEAVQATQIHTFGWPIAPVLDNREYKPIADENGLHAEIDRLADPPGSFMRGYDYWSLGRDGTFYVLKSLFEDRRNPRAIFLDTRVIRTTEVFLRTARMYEALGAPPDEVIACRIEYGGLKDRILLAANPRRFIPFERVCTGSTAEKSFQLPLRRYLDAQGLKEIVYAVVFRITEMCDLFDPTRKITDPMVDTFLQGRVP